MKSEQDKDAGRLQAAGAAPVEKSKARTERPEWASGLRQLYDSVVDEDIPDQFKDLLSQLDTKN
ncbi:MAG: hypothetical protein GW854_09635 [Erythrobacter sp.]|nr:hypothetical protein [Erythrobacter sp.]|tara:strand:+ start:355 stop:546 length:192 start_codon:yes stop_codon:yes gene_type:complete